MATEFSVKRYKNARIGVLVAFVAVALLLVSAWAAIPKIKSYALYADHSPIVIDGNYQFTKKNGVTGGSGTAADPYVIDGWGISAGNSAAVIVMNTDSHVVFRSISVDGMGNSYSTRNGIELRNASNIVFDNVTVRSARYGILVQPVGDNCSEDIHIQNCTVELCITDIYFGKVANGSIGECELRDSTNPAVVVENCTSILLDQNRIHRGQYYGYYDYVSGDVLPDLLIQDTSNISIRQNLIFADSAYTKSANILRSSNVTVSGNYFSSQDSVSISSSKDVVLDNNTGQGFSLTGIDTCTITDNIARGGGYWNYYNPQRFLSVVGSTDLKMLRNQVSYLGGIQVQAATDAEIVGNVVVNCSSVTSISGSHVDILDNLFGGLSVSGDSITVGGNDIVGFALSGYGTGSLDIHDSNWVNVSDNLLSSQNAAYAIVFYLNQDFKLTNNCVVGSMEIWDLVNGNISGNEIRGPADIDLMGGYWSDVSYVHNSMYDVTVRNMSYWVSIAWDGGYPYGGNYWSQYSDVDQRSGVNQNQPGADGIGDSPYDMTVSDTDEYPLIAPVVLADTSPPMTVASLRGTHGNLGWFVSGVNFTLESFDNIAGVNSTYYRMDGGAWIEYSGRVFVTDDGIHTLEYYSIDNSGNEENIRLVEIRIDSERPQPLEGMKLSYYPNNTGVMIIPIEFSDNTSGIGEIVFSTYGSYYSGNYYMTNSSYVQVSISNGSYAFAVSAHDMAGNRCNVFIYVNSTLMVNRDPTSFGGPYGYWYDVGITADIVLIVLILWLSSVIVFGPSRPGPPGGRPGEIDRGEVEDGYPKYLKRA